MSARTNRQLASNIAQLELVADPHERAATRAAVMAVLDLALEAQMSGQGESSSPQGEPVLRRRRRPPGTARDDRHIVRPPPPIKRPRCPVCGANVYSRTADAHPQCSAFRNESQRLGTD
jgi:hypothetical protein